MAHTDIVFDGPPGPEAGRFVEVESATGKSIRFGEWVHSPDGYWALRIITESDLLKNLGELLRVTEADGSRWVSADAFDELLASFSEGRAP